MKPNGINRQGAKYTVVVNPEISTLDDKSYQISYEKRFTQSTII